MASKETWWWVGIGAGAAALVGTGIVLVVHSMRSVTRPESGLEPKPVEPVSPESAAEQAHLSSVVALRNEMCRKWEIEEDSPKWRDELYDLIRNDIREQIRIRRPGWTTIAQLEVASYMVARAALAQACPQVPLPASRQDANELARSGPPYWRELWKLYYEMSYMELSGLSA